MSIKLPTQFKYINLLLLIFFSRLSVVEKTKIIRSSNNNNENYENQAPDIFFPIHFDNLFLDEAIRHLNHFLYVIHITFYYILTFVFRNFFFRYRNTRNETIVIKITTVQQI